MNVITVEEAKLIDEKTCKNISEESLITNVGNNLYKTLQSQYPLDNNDEIVIIAGPGNNGSDSLALGLNLLQFNPTVININNDSFINKLKERNTKIYEVNDLDLAKLKLIINQATVIIDGIFGTGLKNNVCGIYYDIIELINKTSAFVFSIDIPSGINGNNGLVANIAVKASFTAIIEYYKLGNLLNDALDYHGQTKIVTVGLAKPTTNRFLLSKPQLSLRKHNSHKYHYGSVLFIGGKMIGAQMMAAIAALRSGSGLVSLLTNTQINQWEIITVSDFKKALEKKDAICFGPGLGTSDDEYLHMLSKIISYPLLIDADGLYYFKKLGIKKNNIIITPHFGEMARLLDITVEEVANNPLGCVISAINKYQCTVVLKGPCTIIANENEMYFSPYGNPGMATAGSGDVLSGIITSFIGRGLSLIESAKIGVSLHQLAGMIALEKYGHESLIASDIINALPEAFKYLWR